MDAPASRKLHNDPIPLMGGVAIYLGAILAVALFSNGVAQSITGVLIALSIVALVGLIDDRVGLPAWAKLGGQFISFLVLLYYGIHVQLPIPQIANYAITFLWLAGISNAINFLDNMDGLSAGVSAVAASFMLLLAVTNGQILVFGAGGGAARFLPRLFCVTTSNRLKSLWGTPDRCSWVIPWRSWVYSFVFRQTPAWSPGWCPSSF
ncbi:MAG: undecaprenyl/decaprenyl-phosphate alpha-N-acetylglucosaminyl 1-phosphate transferase [Chloroflexi bacterium]|nr:undecaprenyl/decaprenyl-phosphate alpha-N-acetylglucosaminyl 1-phosphate transferase [Chloroflexota bacterium]